MNKRTLAHPAFVLTGLALACALLRLKTFDEPLDGDTTGYAVIAHEMLHGKRLYDDLWDHKPPAIHVTFMVAEWFVGYGEQSIYLLNVAASVVTLLGVYQAGRALAASNSGGLFAAGLWTIVAMEPTLQANQPNTEVFINACQAWALALFLKYAGKTMPVGIAMMLGGITAIASLYKNVAFAPAMLAGIAYVWSQRSGWVQRFKSMLICGGVFVLGWFLTVAYFVLQGRGDAFYECVIRFNSFYMQPFGATFWESVEPKTIAFLLIAMLPAVIAICLPEAVRTSRVKWLLFAAFGIGTHCAVALPGFFHLHYYQFWLPVLCISFAGCWALLALLPVLHPHLRAAAVCSGLLLIIAIPYFRYFIGWDANQWSAHKFKGECIVMKDAGRAIRQLLKPGETFFEWGNHMGLYFYSKLDPIPRLFFIHPLFIASNSPKPGGRAMADNLLAQMTRQVLDAPPDLFVIPRADGAMLQSQIESLPKEALLGFLMREYEPLPGLNPDSFFMFMAQPRSDLMRRVTAGTLSVSDPASGQP